MFQFQCCDFKINFLLSALSLAKWQTKRVDHISLVLPIPKAWLIPKLFNVTESDAGSGGKKHEKKLSWVN